MTLPLPLQNIVCINCKLRKKKCDKTRPSCGYCTTKKLDCQYPSGETKYLSPQPRPLVAIDSPIIHSSWLLSSALSDALLSEPTNADSTIYLQVLRIIRSTGLVIDDVAARYFRGTHSLLPIVSRPRFQDTLTHLGHPPSAGFSVLLLSICLVTYHPEMSESASPPDAASIYLAAKTLFTQVQASFPLSLDLIQAGVIIATYEFASGRVHDAFASIGTSARLGLAARLHLTRPVPGPDGDVNPHTEEEANTWWGILISERTIFCEILDFQQPLATKVPNEPFLPKDPAGLDYRAGLDTHGTPSSTSASTISSASTVSSSPSISSPGSGSDAGGFATLAQAVLFLDQLFQTLEITDLDAKLNRLDGLDHTIRTFLAVAMDQSQGRWGPFCVINSIAFRGLFILHCHIIEQVQYVTQCKRKSPAEWVASSHAVLHTLLRMTGDVVNPHTQIPLAYHDAVPLTTVYLVRFVLDYVRRYRVENVGWDCERVIRTYMEKCDHRWGWNSSKYP